jgi:signal recognition particle subunit SEC65
MRCRPRHCANVWRNATMVYCSKFILLSLSRIYPHSNLSSPPQSHLLLYTNDRDLSYCRGWWHQENRYLKNDFQILKVLLANVICSDLSTINPDKMRLRELKKVLSENGLKCNGCVERREFVNLVKRELLKQDVKDEL